MILIRLIMLICLFTANIQATTHWMVTEKGLIQPKEDSPFLMEKPYDLIEFINQETRWHNIHNLYYDLMKRQKTINKLWYQLERDGNFDRHLSSNTHCSKIGNLGGMDWFTSFLEDGRFIGIPDKEYLLLTYESGDTDVPDCKKISSLTFSMFAFEHLDGMVMREKLNATPEFALPELFAPLMTVEQFGHWVSDVLRKNSSSWLHYNLAAIYWRVRGLVPKALECSRRAVHYAPRRYKSIALLCMGSVLHRSQMTDDAITVLGAAVDHHPTLPISHFTLGEAYAVQGDFNSSLKHFNISLKLHKKFELAKKFKNGILCHIDMFKKMQKAKSTIKDLRKELKLFLGTEVLWLKIQTAFLKSMKHDGKFELHNLEGNMKKMSEITGMQVAQVKEVADMNFMIQQFMEGLAYDKDWENEKGVGAIETAYALQRVVKNIAMQGYPMTMSKVDESKFKNRTIILNEIGPMAPFPTDMYLPKRVPPLAAILKKDPNEGFELNLDNLQMGVLEPQKLEETFPPNMKVPRHREPFDTDPDWPTRAVCQQASLENLHAVYPVYLPPENKGLKLSGLLSLQIGTPALTPHPLPWHPPACESPGQSTQSTKKGIKIQLAPEPNATQYLRERLLRYVSDSNHELLKRMDDAEIGQRISTAMDKAVAPRWSLLVVASLYWRVRARAGAARACLRAALRGAARDAALASLASLALEQGQLDDAAAYIEEAYRINPYEPATNFVLAQISMLKKNQRAQMFHMKQVVRVSPKFMGGLPRKILTSWACILKQVDTLKEIGDISKPWFCAEVEDGQSMVCDRDGANCHVRHHSCDQVREQAESTILRLLELQDSLSDEIDRTIFDKFAEKRPPDRKDITNHRKNFDVLVNTVDFLLKGCGHRGCDQLKPEHLALSDEDCSHQHLQLDYWLNVVNFKQVADHDDKIVSETIATEASSKSIPECEIPLGPYEDFFLARIMDVDIDDWGPVISTMHTLTEAFGYYDFANLGAKIAKFIDDFPERWAGLVGAAWWCGAGGRGRCARDCAAAAFARAPPHLAHLALRPLSVILHQQAKYQEAKKMSYLGFYMSPKSEFESFLVAASHTYKFEYEQAAWMYRYALTFDEKFLPAKACLHITMCLMTYGETARKRLNAVPA